MSKEGRATMSGPNSAAFCTQRPHAGISNQENSLQQAVAKLQNPPQVEWEKLWFQGIAASFQRVAQDFPDSLPNRSTTGLHTLNCKTTTISEPTLSISKLRAEDRAIFEQDEKIQKRNTFIPQSNSELLQRERKAARARNVTEKFALLLGLPTYEEYHSRKARELQIVPSPNELSQRQLKRKARVEKTKERRRLAKAKAYQRVVDEGYFSSEDVAACAEEGMSHQKSSSTSSKDDIPIDGAQHRPLVVGLTKTRSSSNTPVMASSADVATLNKEIAENVKSNVGEAAPSADNPTAPASLQPKKEKKEKAPKQPKQPKGGAAAAPAPTSPALIDLRVGHILRAIAHPNADTLYVSTIAMGDPEGTEHTTVDEQTGKVVRTVCSGLNGLVPLADMQDRKIIVVANLKPVNMRSIKSAAMVLAASPKQEEGADPHGPDRVVELVEPPAGAEAGDKVYFEGWPYGEGKGPEKQLNPKKKQWEAIQPGFYTSDGLTVGFDASKCEDVDGDGKGDLVVEGKGVCKVKTLKGAVVK